MPTPAALVEIQTGIDSTKVITKNQRTWYTRSFAEESAFGEPESECHVSQRACEGQDQ